MSDSPIPGQSFAPPPGNGIIYHLCLPEDWKKARVDKIYAPLSLKTEGFIHFSAWEEVLTSASLYFKGAEEIWMLHVVQEKLQPDLKWEPSRDDLYFPHLYRKLLWEEVHSISSLRPNGDSWTVSVLKE